MPFVASSFPPDSYKLRKIPPSVNSLFNVIAHTGKQLRQFKFSAHSLIVAMLSHRAFVSKVDQRIISHGISQFIKFIIYTYQINLLFPGVFTGLKNHSCH